MVRAKLKQYYHLGLTKELLCLQDKVYADVLAFAKFKSGDSNLDNLTPELDSLCDAYFLIQSGALECVFTDRLPDEFNEGIVLRLNL